MEYELRVCIARAALNANLDLRFRIDIVKFIQRLLNELFYKSPPKLELLKTDSLATTRTVTPRAAFSYSTPK